MAARLFVVWQIAFQNAKRFKILLELEINEAIEEIKKKQFSITDISSKTGQELNLQPLRFSLREM